MAQQNGAAGKSQAASVLHSRFMVGSVSEENSEDENLGKADLQLEEKENRSLSPSSCSSDSAYETGFDHVDGTAHNLRLAIKPFLFFFLMWQIEYQITGIQMQFAHMVYSGLFVTFSVFFVIQAFSNFHVKVLFFWLPLLTANVWQTVASEGAQSLFFFCSLN